MQLAWIFVQWQQRVLAHMIELTVFLGQRGIILTLLRLVARRMCNTSELDRRFNSIEHHLWWDIDSVAINVTGCVPPCDYYFYKLEKVVGEYDRINSDNAHKYEYLVQIYYMHTMTEIVEEFFAFDLQGLLGELGGSLGLFLGWSCWHAGCQLVDLVTMAMRSLKTKK